MHRLLPEAHKTFEVAGLVLLPSLGPSFGCQPSELHYYGSRVFSQATADWHTCRQIGGSSCRVRTGLPHQASPSSPGEPQLENGPMAENCGQPGGLAEGLASSRTR